MTVNMGPQHPSTHGVLRLVLELDGETVLSASPTIGYLHTGIEKTAEQKKWQQVIPLVERMDYLSAHAVSVMLYCCRERELLLNLNEMLAGFRMSPSYMRVGGLREDLPRGFHEAVSSFLDRFVPKLHEYEDLLTENEIYIERTRGVGKIAADAALAFG